LLCNTAADRFLYIDPGDAPGSQHVTLDLADLLTNFVASALTVTTLSWYIAADRFLYIDPDPSGVIGAQHVTLDLADLLTNFSAAARAARRGCGYRGNLAAGLLPDGEGVINVEDDDSDDDDIAELSLLGAAAWAAAAGQVSSGASSSSSSNVPPQQRQQQQQQRPNSGASSSGRIMSGTGGGPADLASAEADLAALETMNYEPPENMQVCVLMHVGRC
jgi:hypothetical protein